jgi:hypothetical protein
MGPLSYMQSVVDRNIVQQHILVHSFVATMKVESANSSTTLTAYPYQSKRHHIPRDGNVQQQHSKNVKLCLCTP